MDEADMGQMSYVKRITVFVFLESLSIPQLIWTYGGLGSQVIPWTHTRCTTQEIIRYPLRSLIRFLIAVKTKAEKLLVASQFILLTSFVQM